MNALDALLMLPEAEKFALGVLHTPAEIAQQPDTWAAVARLLQARREEIRAFMTDVGLLGERKAVVLLSGAGSSEFIGNAAAGALRKSLQREVFPVPSTHLVTHASAVFLPGGHYVLVSFSRSGDSPESVAGYRLARQAAAQVRQVVITCNADGALAGFSREDPNSLSIVLPEETNDRSLVMTSAFSTMAFCVLSLGLLDDTGCVEHLALNLGRGARRILAAADLIREFAERPFTRACFLGSNTLAGTMQECQLKMLEMTDGRISSRFDSFLGLRHGPQVFVNDKCIVVAALSSEEGPRRYELDMLGELKGKGQGAGTLVVCDRRTREIDEVASVVIELFPDGEGVADCYRVVTDVVVGQLLGLFKSLQLGLKPDAPSASGTIHRVVQGVTIYN